MICEECGGNFEPENIDQELCELCQRWEIVAEQEVNTVDRFDGWDEGQGVPIIDLPGLRRTRPNGRK